jgi:spermidine synthase
MAPRQIQYGLYLVFALSGATGLIYESVWSHYLKQFLGHAAYAQSLVLIIFMGGMAAGAWLISHYGKHIKNMLLAYAIVEGVIGIIGIVFHTIYVETYLYSFDIVIPSLGSPEIVQIYKIFIASLLILPQSILLGATFPLMSGGFIRKFPMAPGHSISFLYFSNSIGAALAVLISAFYLISKTGLPGTMMTAGIINILLAITVYFMVKSHSRGHIHTDTREDIRKTWPVLILSAAFFTGMASFIYEIAWIRMLSMVLGASTHSFELMLSAFITGLAIGGFWIRKRIDTLKNPVIFAAMVQIAMGAFSLLTIVLYNNSFYVQSFFMSALKETDQGYFLFNLASHSIALLIMLPTTICAGMTLPLFTYILINKGHGEKSIGQIYSSNTLGAIFGVVFAVFIGMPLLSLKGTIFTGAIIDVVIGILLFRTVTVSMRSRTGYITATFGIIILLSAIFTRFDTSLMASSVFRLELADPDSRSEVIYHKDGKTASVSVTNWKDVSLSIITNGKPDAAMTIVDDAPPGTDESTMTLLGALPLLIKPDAQYFANIGLGSGLTSHVVLGSPKLKRIDTIEIESAIVEGARFYGKKTERVYTDPRSNIHIEDAKTFFSTYQNKYDVIISEPSNPWVSGVSNLFTQEFYQTVKRHLNPSGILVQWIHIYEFNLDLLISILKAISNEFTYYDIYFADDGNLILVASENHPIPRASDEVFDVPALNKHLSTIFINNIDDIHIRFLGNQKIFNAFINHSSIPVNSDYFPYLDQNATRARFLKQDVREILNLRLNTMPLIDLIYSEFPDRKNYLSTTNFFNSNGVDNANNIYNFFSEQIFNKDNIAEIASVNFLNSAAKNCSVTYNTTVWIDSIFMLLSKVIPYLPDDQVNEMLDAFEPKCNIENSRDSHLNWLAVFRAIMDKDYNEINRSSVTLLTNNYFNDIEQKKYLQTSFLLGLIKTGNFQDAIDFWKDEMAALFIVNGKIPLEYEILLSQIQLNN